MKYFTAFARYLNFLRCTSITQSKELLALDLNMMSVKNIMLFIVWKSTMLNITRCSLGSVSHHVHASEWKSDCLHFHKIFSNSCRLVFNWWTVERWKNVKHMLVCIQCLLYVRHVLYEVTLVFLLHIFLSFLPCYEVTSATRLLLRRTRVRSSTVPSSSEIRNIKRDLKPYL